MDRDEAIRRAEIAMAWAKGEAVQFTSPYTEGWHDHVSAENNAMPRFFNPDYEWRIKPQPLECWAEMEWHKNVPTGITCWSPNKPEIGGRWVRMREVEE